MPSLVQPLDHGLARVKVEVAVSPPRATALRAKGLVVPSPVQAHAVLDSAAEISCIDLRIRAALGVPPHGTTPLLSPGTAAAPPICNLFKISLRIIHPQATPQADLVPDVLSVVETDLLPLSSDMLIGCDVLGQCLFVYNGRGGTFTLDY